MMKEVYCATKVLGHKIEDPGSASLVIIQCCYLLYTQNNSAENTLRYVKFDVYVTVHRDKFV
jgi:hypothetical protein